MAPNKRGDKFLLAVRTGRTPRQCAFVLALALMSCTGAIGQCTNNNTLTGAAITVPCPGSTTVPCIQGGQYALVNVTLGNIYTFSTCTGISFDTQITLFNNTGGASLGYNDDFCGLLGLQSSVQWTSTFSGQLRVLVDQFPCASNTTCIPLTVQCAAPPPPVTNNDPCQAQVLGVTNNCIPNTFSNVGATLTTVPVIPVPGCGNMVAGSADVWFLFTAPPSGIAIIETGAGTLTDGAMALYTATPNCNGTYNLVQCDDDSGPGLMPLLSFSNLIPGNQYYVRFWGFGAATGTFTLCIHGPTSIPAGNCVYLLQVYDSFGDGWDGSYVTITINGVPYGNYTNNGTYNAFLIGVNIGQVLVVQYTAVGLFEGDNRYTLSFLSTNQVVFNSGTPPVPGVVYTTTVTCNPPPAVPEDCVGGITLCNSQGVNNNTNNTGSVADLNPSNYGCLLASEQQGTWYNFSISNGGTLGMTIDPTALDATAPDYDWAVWGPYPAGSTTTGICPPLGTPVRCSFASGFDSFSATGGYNTGMGINNLAWANPRWAAPLPIWSDPAGGGDGWTPGLNVTTGQVYLLYISNFSNTGQAFTLSWQLGSGASLDCTVLPVELVSLSAAPAGDNVLVRWSTASEQDAQRYDVHRSRDGVDFDPIGQVEAAGTSTVTTDYHFIDRNPLIGMNFYRLDQVDNDGTHTLSNIVALERSSSASTGGPFPNPVTGMAWWLLPENIPFERVDVFDALGRAIVRSVRTPDADRLVQFDTALWPEGAYSLVAYAGCGEVLLRASLIKY